MSEHDWWHSHVAWWVTWTSFSGGTLSLPHSSLPIAHSAARRGVLPNDRRKAFVYYGTIRVEAR